MSFSKPTARKLLYFLVFTAALSGSIFFLKSKQSQLPTQHSQKTVSVVTTFYPLAEFTKAIGKDTINITNLTPAGTEPHDFDPSPKDLIAIKSASLFILNGASFEQWIETLSPDITNSVTTVDTSVGVPLIRTGKKTDPHIWLSPLLAAQQVQTIATALQEKDPANAEFYKKNTQAYIAQLKDLDADFRKALSTCNVKTIVTSHSAFGYLAREYGLEVISISGFSPDEEPTPKKLAEISTLVTQKGIKYIFFENLVSPKLAQTVATETGASIVQFNTIEGLTPEQAATDTSYISLQRENLETLRNALECK